MTQLFDNEIDAEDRVYLHFRDYPPYQDAKEHIETMWGAYEPYADTNFRSEITRAFFERYWEMYLAWGLLENSFSLSSAGVGPDVGVSFEFGTVWLEAISPKPGQGENEVPQLGGEDGQVVVSIYPEDKILLRIRSAFEEKHRKYLGYVEKGTISADEPYIVAINGCQTPGAFVKDELPIAVRAVFPFGNPQVTIDTETSEVLRSNFAYRRDVKKASGTSIGTDVFLDDAYTGVSALLFSCSDPINRRGAYGEDFVLVHNPLACNPLEKGTFKFGQEFWAEEADGNMSLESTKWL
jgi:type I restriction enzyme S subunit